MKAPKESPRLDRIVVWPFRMVGLTGADGLVSFSKIVTVAIVVSYFVRRPVPLGITMAVIASSYGIKAFLALVQSKAITSHESASASVDVAAIMQAARTAMQQDSRVALEGQYRVDPGA